MSEDRNLSDDIGRVDGLALQGAELVPQVPVVAECAVVGWRSRSRPPVGENGSSGNRIAPIGWCRIGAIL